MTINTIYNQDCMDLMKEMPNNSVDLTLTDIPYNEVNRKSNGIRNLDKGIADIMTFDLNTFLCEIDRVTRKTIIVFCGREQMSEIYRYFSNLQKQQKGTVRQLIWKKTNPSPMNGKYIYLSGIENAVWFKKRGGTFNAHCKNTVFEYPIGRSKIHPTEKNHNLIKELILDNSNEKDIIFDPCAGSESHCLVAHTLNRQFIGCEIDELYANIANNRIKSSTPGE